MPPAHTNDFSPCLCGFQVKKVVTHCGLLTPVCQGPGTQGPKQHVDSWSNLLLCCILCSMTSKESATTIVGGGGAGGGSRQARVSPN